MGRSYQREKGEKGKTITREGNLYPQAQSYYGYPFLQYRAIESVSEWGRNGRMLLNMNNVGRC